MNQFDETGYLPQTSRLSLLHRGIGLGLISLLMFYLSVCVTFAEPKMGALIAAFCIYLGGRRLLAPHSWPILAIIAYGAAIGLIFPGPKPPIGLALAHPLFDLDCVLLAALGLGGQSVRRQYVLLLGILVICLIGTVGDLTGHDMTALLPFQMPDDDYFDKVTLLQGDVSRVRGFFPESGVLGAVSLGFATILGLGALVLIRLKVSLRFAWLGLFGAVSIGGAIFCLAVTKSGLVMAAAGFAGFIAVLFAARNGRCRAAAFLAVLLVGLLGCAFLAAGPASLTSYFRGEITAFLHPDQMGAAMAGHSGTITRLKCWQLAFTSIRLYPLGVGPYGLGSVILQAGDGGFTQEMRLFFSRDIFGLKNAFANLIAQCGIVGLGFLFYWLWIAFLQPIRHLLADGSERNAIVGGVYGASAVACLAFLFSCELYPSLAFLLVLKFHADAIAQACAIESTSDAGNLELIG